MEISNAEFLEKIKPLVIEDMKKNGILASLTAAQGLIESRSGNSGLAAKCNNLFGIKGTYNGQGQQFMTTEYYNGVAQRVMATFRQYPSWAESIADHSGIFNRLARYKNLRGLTDYNLACVYVQADGYATAPDYSTTLLKTINMYHLYLWDAEVTGKQAEAQQQKQTQPTLKKGQQNEYVRHWQKFLNANSYDCGYEDGFFGANTEIAVMQWQQAHGIEPVSGIIGPKTWASIGL